MRRHSGLSTLDALGRGQPDTTPWGDAPYSTGRWWAIVVLGGLSRPPRGVRVSRQSRPGSCLTTDWEGPELCHSGGGCWEPLGALSLCWYPRGGGGDVDPTRLGRCTTRRRQVSLPSVQAPFIKRKRGACTEDKLTLRLLSVLSWPVTEGAAFVGGGSA
jgi:hypothetical protein